MLNIFFFLTFISTSIQNTPSKHKTIAVIEYRSGVMEQANFTTRVASIIKTKTNLKVLTNTDARRILGNSFDEEVSKCQSDFKCYAKIGKKLKVDEILIVLISEFGNILINTNRIIVKSGKVKGSFDLDITKGGRVSKIQIYFALKKIFPESYFKRYGFIIITSNSRDASVFINQKKLGLTPIPPIKLKAPQKYKIKLQKKGFTPFKAEVLLVPNAQLKLNAQLLSDHFLTKEKWYQKWWVWTIASSALLISSGVFWYYYNSPNTVPTEVILE